MPAANLLDDAAGDLFGTTTSGGAYGDGTVFEIKAGTGNVTTLANFDGSNGADSYGALSADAAGDLFGTTASGGAKGDGTVFEIWAGSGSITTLVNFDGDNGASPRSGLLIDAAGNIFGTTLSGGA